MKTKKDESPEQQMPEHETAQASAEPEQASVESPVKSEQLPVDVSKEPNNTGASAKPLVRKESTKKYVKRQIVTYTTLLLAGFLSAFNMAAFVLPNGFVSGGVSGFALIMGHVTKLNSGLFLLMFNIPLVIIAFFFISKKLAFKSLVSVGASALFLWLFGLIDGFWTYVPEPETKLLPAAVGGVLGGISLAIILKNGSSNGGTDVIATLIQKKRADINIAWMILILDMSSIVVSVFIFREEGTLFNIEPLILAVAYKFVSAKVCETILEGIKSAMKFEIVTTHPEEVSNEIMQKLHRGVTKVEATGMYSHESRALLICVIRRRELTGLQRIIRKYPDTFCYISSTSEVLGKFSHTAQDKEEAPGERK